MRYSSANRHSTGHFQHHFPVPVRSKSGARQVLLQFTCAGLASRQLPVLYLVPAKRPVLSCRMLVSVPWHLNQERAIVLTRSLGYSNARRTWCRWLSVLCPGATDSSCLLP